MRVQGPVWAALCYFKVRPWGRRMLECVGWRIGPDWSGQRGAEEVWCSLCVCGNRWSGCCDRYRFLRCEPSAALQAFVLALALLAVGIPTGRRVALLAPWTLASPCHQPPKAAHASSMASTTASCTRWRNASCRATCLAKAMEIPCEISCDRLMAASPVRPEQAFLVSS